MTLPIFLDLASTTHRASALEQILFSDTRRANLPELNGILAIDKPVGMTSHDVVSRIRRFVGMKRVGHGGTLDPFASGVLIVAVGKATRVLQYVQMSDKRYHAHIVLGVETDSHDVDGEITVRDQFTPWPDMAAVAAAVSEFVGELEQIPPAYSAIKIGGRKLYQMARAGEKVDVPTRRVTIHTIDILEYNPPDLYLAVHCGKGTYIRSIARDIGAVLGVGAYCHGLRRVTNGPFCLADCWALDDLAAMDIRGNWPSIGMHPDAALQRVNAVVLSEAGKKAWYHGRSVPVPTTRSLDDGELLRVYADQGRFLGIGAAIHPGVIQPKFVLSSTDEDVEV